MVNISEEFIIIERLSQAFIQGQIVTSPECPSRNVHACAQSSEYKCKGFICPSNVYLSTTFITCPK